MTKSKVVTFQGNPLTLVSKPLEKGTKAPDFTVLDNSLNPLKLSDFKGKPVLIIAVPSLDTPVCDMEVRKFNEKAAGLNSDLKIVTVSMDLPFAQARWCGAAGIDRVVTASDHREASFGNAYGVLIKELRLLARSLFLVDTKGDIAYTQLVEEVTSEPDYDEVIDAIKKL